MYLFYYNTDIYGLRTITRKNTWKPIVEQYNVSTKTMQKLQCSSIVIKKNY